jgi:hypothetical protein
MSTDLTIHEDQPREFRPADPTGGRLVAWAEGLAAAHRIGSALCQTAFVPQTFRGKPEEAAAAILYGDEIGFTPTQALQNIYVISGKPSMYARSMVALVLHHGHEVWTVEKSSAKVTVAGRRKGSTHVIEETWTTARASKAGYTNNKKYTSDPESMLYARAAADVCRQIAPDALAGLAYVAEELELAEDQPTTTVRRTAPATKAQRAVMAEPELTPAPEPEPVTADTITDAQMKHLHASFNDLGISDRDQRLAYCTNLLGRDVESSKELSKDEASRVIDALKADAGDAADVDPDPWADA